MARCVSIKRRKKGPGASGATINLPTDTTEPILISRRLGGVGDVIMILPALLGLREKFPKAYITFALTNKWGPEPTVLLDLLKGNPNINKLLPITPPHYPELSEAILTHKAYMDLTGHELRVEYRGNSKHRTDFFCERLDVKPSTKTPSLYLSRFENAYADEYLNKIGAELPPVAIQPTCFGSSRNWPESRMVDLAKYITRELQRKVIVISATDTDPYVGLKDVFVRRGGSIREHAAVIKKCAFLVGADSGLLHLSGAVGTPVIGLFGSVPPTSRLAYYPGSEWVWHSEMPCIGCYYRHDCPPHKEPYKPCMEKITLDEVCERVKTKLENPTNRKQGASIKTTDFIAK